MSTKQPSTSVFVGNIPYGLTEEQIIDIFSQAGKVLSFRLVYDRETGRPKGFGFAEYPDADSAASAVRNLNDHEVMNRKLRVDFSNDGGEDDSSTPAGYQQPPLPSNGVPIPPPPSQNGSTLPPLPIGVDLPPGLTCPDAISRTLNTLPPAQLLDVLSQMKTLVTTDTAKAVELLRQAPQLSYAIFQALLLMGLVSTDALATVVEQSNAAPGSLPSTSIPQPVTAQLHGQYGPPPVPGQAYATTYPVQPHLGGQTSAPPSHGLAYPASQPQLYQQPPPAAVPQRDTDDLVTQVMNMPQSVLDMLPPGEKAQLEALRASFAGQAR